MKRGREIGIPTRTASHAAHPVCACAGVAHVDAV